MEDQAEFVLFLDPKTCDLLLLHCKHCVWGGGMLIGLIRVAATSFVGL